MVNRNETLNGLNGTRIAKYFTWFTCIGVGFCMYGWNFDKTLCV